MGLNEAVVSFLFDYNEIFFSSLTVWLWIMSHACGTRAICPHTRAHQLLLFCGRPNIHCENRCITYIVCFCIFDLLPSVLWHCWLGVKKSIQPVKLSDNVLHLIMEFYIVVMLLTLCLLSLVFHHPSLFHSRLKTFLSANPSHHSLSFLLQDWLHRFPRLFTDTSEHIRFFTF